MTNPYPDKIWLHKNFNMGLELEIAGEFIYDGIHTVNQIKSVKQEAMVFSMLYHISVGIERIQKIILTLLEDISLDSYKEFEKSLITHSHMDLQSRINRFKKFELISRENDFLCLLTVFYNTGRYNRFNLVSSYENESSAVSAFILKYTLAENQQFGFTHNELLFSDSVKELFGRVVGSISKKYYDFLKEICWEKNLYTYELNSHSKSAKIFYNTFRKKSLQEQKICERVALGEFIIFLMNTKEKNPTLWYMKTIQSLDIDPALIQQYIDELSQGIISQDMIDEVESLYDDIENHYERKERKESILAFSDTNVYFDIGIIFECISLIENFLENKIPYDKFYEKINECLSCLDLEEDDDLERLSSLCKVHIKDLDKRQTEFKQSLKHVNESFKERYRVSE